MTQLSQLVDVQSIQADGTSLTLTTSGGAALVVGNQSFNLTTQTNPTSGFQDVFSQERDITASITGAIWPAIFSCAIRRFPRCNRVSILWLRESRTR
jgi:hypothetical protein